MHANEERTRRAYDAFGTGDLDGAMGSLADDCVWHVRGVGPLTGDYRGKEEILGFFGKLAQITMGSFRIEIRDVLANDQRSVVIARNTMTLDGEQVESDTVAVYEADADGLVKEGTFYVADPVEAVRIQEQLNKAARAAGVAA